MTEDEAFWAIMEAEYGPRHTGLNGLEVSFEWNKDHRVPAEDATLTQIMGEDGLD